MVSSLQVYSFPLNKCFDWSLKSYLIINRCSVKTPWNNKRNFFYLVFKLNTIGLLLGKSHFKGLKIVTSVGQYNGENGLLLYGFYHQFNITVLSVLLFCFSVSFQSFKITIIFTWSISLERNINTWEGGNTVKNRFASGDKILS